MAEPAYGTATGTEISERTSELVLPSISVSEPPEMHDALERKAGLEESTQHPSQTPHSSQTPHPSGLGSALTHPHITTDFSEAQLELITGVHANADDCMKELDEIHGYVLRHQQGNREAITLRKAVGRPRLSKMRFASAF